MFLAPSSSRAVDPYLQTLLLRVSLNRLGGKHRQAQHRERGRENYVGDLGWAADSCGAACWAVEAETTAAHDVAVQHHGRPRPFPICSLPVAPSPSSPRPGARRPSSTLRQLGSSLARPEGPRAAALARLSGGFAL